MQIKRQIQAALAGQALLLLAAINSGEMARGATGTLPPPTKTKYHFTIIDIPDQQFMAPFGPNAEGIACGFYLGNDGLWSGFLWRDGRVTPLDAPGWSQTVPNSINDRGEVAGIEFETDQSVQHTFLYRIRDETWTQLPDVPNMPVVNAVVINNEGTIVGSSSQGDQLNYYNSVGWTWDGRSYSFFTVPGASETGFGSGTWPLGLNDRGQVTGYYTDDSGYQHGFLKDRSTITTFDVPGADLIEPGAINDNGDIAGTWYALGPVYQEEGFILHEGHFVTFEVPGVTGGLTSINDRGEVAGTYADSSGIWHGFVATPEHN